MRELAILALVASVRDKVIADGISEQIECQISTTGSHESNGAAERTVQQVREMARVYLAHVREKTGSVFPSSSPWWAWALRHAASTYNRFHVRADTWTTPYSKTRLKVYAFAEESDAVVDGCWLGTSSHTEEHIVVEHSWCISHTSGSKIDIGQELVG